MCDQWLPKTQIPLTAEEFARLPRHPGYHYAHYDGRAWIWPGARHRHAVLDLPPSSAPIPKCLRLLLPSDLDELVPVFVDAFRGVFPFDNLDDSQLREAGQECLRRAMAEQDGPFLSEASFTLRRENEIEGAAVVTLLPPGDPADDQSYYWQESPEEAPDRGVGRPHLTWIFVARKARRGGKARQLLAAVCSALTALGHSQLLSTFLLGNDDSLLWHWRNGFRLVAEHG